MLQCSVNRFRLHSVACAERHEIPLFIRSLFTVATRITRRHHDGQTDHHDRVIIHRVKVNRKWFSKLERYLDSLFNYLRFTTDDLRL